MTDHPSASRKSDIALTMDTSHLPGRDVLDRATFRLLNARSNWRGACHFLTHLSVVLLTGLLLQRVRTTLALLVPVMVVHGIGLVTLFAAMHECVHNTAFRSRWLNRAVGWIAGVLSFNNSDYYRRFHYWHHRFTQLSGRDPELTTSKLTRANYLFRMSGLSFWVAKLRQMRVVSSGRIDHLPFISAAARRGVVISMRMQVILYAMVAVSVVGFGLTTPLVYWFVPMLLGQPFLRAMLLAEHTGCSEDNNGLTNTRTTLTWWPVRFVMWNMPYHAEHHLYPSIPFHALPRAHPHIRNHITHLDHGYGRVHRTIWRNLTSVESE